MTAESLWTVHDVAKFLNLAVGSVYHLVSANKIPCIRLSARCLRFWPSEIRAWVESKTQKGGSDTCAPASRQG